MKTIGITHIGNSRTTNEDTLLIECAQRPRFMLVADGMGGHAAGEVASKTAAVAIRDYIEGLRVSTLSHEQIRAAVEHANKELLAEMDRNTHLQGMGTTLTFAYAEGDRLTLAQVGDSSAYLYDGALLKKLTRDHTYVQHLIDSGVIKKNAEKDYPFKNIITRAVGMRKLKVDISDVAWKEEDMLLLCSDGLTAYVSDEMLFEVLADDRKIEEKAKTLVNHALESGGKDNISLIIARNIPEEAV